MKKLLLTAFSSVLFAPFIHSQCNPVYTDVVDIYEMPAAGQCEKTITYTSPAFTGCSTGNSVQTAGLASGSNFPIGITTNTFEVYNDVTIFEEDFSDNSAGWTLGTEWQIGSATVSSGQSASGGNPDPGIDNTATADNGVAGVNIGGNATTTLHSMYYITSPTINTAGLTNVTLSFYRWLNSDYTPFMTNAVEVFDGTTWQVLWQSSGAPGVQDAAWTMISYDLSLYANANMSIRFGHSVGSTGAYTVSSWNIDDVVITAYASTGISSSFNVYVSNPGPEIAVTQNDTTLLNNTGSLCSEPLSFNSPVINNCGPYTLTQTSGPTTGSEFPIGTTPVIHEVTQDSAMFKVYFTEDFSDNTAGWNLGNEWGIGSAIPSTGGFVNGDPGFDNTATSDNGVAGVVIGGNASTTVHPYYYLTSPVVNTAGSADLYLDFYRWLNSDYTPYMANIIEVYDGSAWQSIWVSGPSPAIADNSWTNHVFNIQPYSNAQLQVRFGFQIGSSGVFSVSSWNLDDVLIYGDATLSVSDTFNVTVDTAYFVQSTSICDGTTVTFGSQTISSAGIYIETFSTASGCDSIIELTVSTLPTSAGTDTQSACGSYTWIDGNTYTSSNNTATYTLVNALGCDSVVTLDLTVSPLPDVLVTQTGQSIAAGQSGAVYQWLDCDNNLSAISGETNQTFNPTVAGNYAVNVTLNGCTDTSECFAFEFIGLEDLTTENHLLIYPNPTNNKVTIRFTGENAIIALFDSQGKLIFNASVMNEDQIDLSNYENGVYMLQTTIDQTTTITRIIKQ